MSDVLPSPGPLDGGSRVRAHNARAQSVWNAPGGRYDEISRTIADAIEHAVERLNPRPGEHVLDLATGTGWASRIVAQRFHGCSVLGVDIAEQMLAYARSVAALQNLNIEYRHGDAEKLPVDDASIDAVVSTFGVMFASDPDAAASELARVVRPGGRVVLATWRADSNVAHMFGVMKKFMQAPAQPAPSPFAWGNVERVQQLLGDKFEVAFEEGTNHFRYASGAEAWELWVNHYGPTKSLAASLDDMRRGELERALVEWHETFASALGYEQPRRYLITRAVRRA